VRLYIVVSTGQLLGICSMQRFQLQKWHMSSFCSGEKQQQIWSKCYQGHEDS